MLSSDRRILMVPINSPALAERVRVASEEDDHGGMLLPTHAFLKNGEIVGCTSLGAVNMAHTWLHKSKMKTLDTHRACHDVETVARSVGFRALAVTVVENSAMFAHMRDLGFTDCGPTRTFIKFLAVEPKA